MSTISDVRAYLAADDAAAGDDLRRLKKAKWRAREGFDAQEGVDVHELQRRVEEREAAQAEERSTKKRKQEGKTKKPEDKEGRVEKRKANRDYQLVMNQMKRTEGGGGGGKANEED